MFIFFIVWLLKLTESISLSRLFTSAKDVLPVLTYEAHLPLSANQKAGFGSVDVWRVWAGAALSHVSQVTCSESLLNNVDMSWKD